MVLPPELELWLALVLRPVWEWSLVSALRLVFESRPASGSKRELVLRLALA